MTILTKEQAKWVDELNAGNPDLPAGYARAMVEMYIESPELFTDEQIEAWRNTPVPVLEKTNGHAETYTGEEAERIFAKMRESLHVAECVPLESENNEHDTL